MKFTLEKEQNQFFNFLDVQVVKEYMFMRPQVTMNPLMVITHILLVTCLWN